MKEKMSCFERRIAILLLLIQNKKMTLTELASKFSVHKNTAYNDINFLSQYAPIYTKSGIDGGIYIVGNYRNELFIYLSAEEEQCLREIIADVDDTRKFILENIINKFSLPKLSI